MLLCIIPSRNISLPWRDKYDLYMKGRSYVCTGPHSIKPSLRHAWQCQADSPWRITGNNNKQMYMHLGFWQPLIQLTNNGESQLHRFPQNYMSWPDITCRTRKFANPCTQPKKLSCEPLEFADINRTPTARVFVPFVTLWEKECYFSVAKLTSGETWILRK